MNLSMIFGGTKTPLGYASSLKQVPKGYSKDKAYQDQKPAGQIGVNNSTGAGPDGLNTSYGYQNYYKIESGPQAAPAPAPAAAPPPSSQLDLSNAFNDRLKQIQDANKVQTDGLMQQMADDRKNYEDLTSKYEKSISAYQNSFNQGSSVGGQESALMINPAQSNATKKKRTSKGTQQFNRNLKVSNVSI